MSDLLGGAVNASRLAAAALLLRRPMSAPRLLLLALAAVALVVLFWSLAAPTDPALLGPFRWTPPQVNGPTMG